MSYLAFRVSGIATNEFEKDYNPHCTVMYFGEGQLEFRREDLQGIHQRLKEFTGFSITVPVGHIDMFGPNKDIPVIVLPFWPLERLINELRYPIIHLNGSEFKSHTPHVTLPDLDDGLVINPLLTIHSLYFHNY